MDAKVDDFFNEINEIAPQKPSREESVWKKCHDEATGYHYYWNVNTGEVTWAVPPDFDPLKQNTTEKTPAKTPEIQLMLTHSEAKLKLLEKEKQKAESKKPNKNTSDSDDEKITLISSYGGDTESETEDEPEVKKQKVETKQDSESEDDVDILAKIQKRAKELKALGGDLPPEVAKIADTNSPIEKNDSKNNAVSSISLVAGYSDSEEEDEEVKSVLSAETQTSCSTLFPIAQKIDVKDFMEPKLEDNKQTENDFTSKAFLRKKRIDVSFVVTGKKNDDCEDPDNERRGFGYSDETKPIEKGSTYLGFTKGGVMFAKSKSEEETCDKKTENEVNKQELNDMYNTLIEKLEFLNDGRVEVPPTQVMVIQVQTLYTAMSSGGLKQSYLQNWLKETCTELVKLEKESTPEGWLLQWDRSHKRYYYQNVKTGASQWEYPQPTDVERCDDAMDISTTPPPEQVIRMSPPLPPVIRCPTPPPPPIISKPDDVPPLPPNSPPMKQVLNGEPLPPGVDIPEIPTYDKKDVDSLNTALDSFYSEVAAIESPKSLSPQPPASQPVEENKTMDAIDVNTDSVKKKKKKVKLAPGLALKKKGVSQLVEKWKNVQQQFNKD